MFGFMQNQAQRRRFSGLLALLWALYAVGGVVLADGSPPAAPSAQSASQTHACPMTGGPVCHCTHCHGVLRNGKRACCCLAASPSTPTAALSARCDGGGPDTRTAVASWPVVRAPRPATLPLSYSPRARFARAADVDAPSRTLLPPTPPPCLL